MERELTYIEAIREATEICLEEDPAVTVIGLGVPDPKGIFGTTAGLQEKFGLARILDAPISENGLTGMVIGGALAGLRPILTHQRVDFALLSLEQIINQAAKWHYMFDAKGGSVPIVIRMIVGRGWGQGPQHSQSLHSLFAHIPGLRVVAPSTPREAKGVLLSAVRDPNPVIYIEHRWLHGLKGPVPYGGKGLSLNSAAVACSGCDITIAAFSYGLIEAMRAARFLAESSGIDCEVVDLRTLNPLDWTTIEKSIAKTRRLLVIDEDHRHCGFSAEIMARAMECPVELQARPKRLTLPDVPSPSSSFLASEFYYDASDICREILVLCGKDASLADAYPLSQWADKPSFDFPGPF
jgi:acetoin:2,6-dichlorophenolindophenol oxidoreductase subunit beta